MGYRVDYQPIKKLRGAEKRHMLRPALTGIFFLLFVIVLHTAWPRGEQALRELLLPGEAAQTVAAFNTFARDLKEGQTVHRALEDFCRSVIPHG